MTETKQQAVESSARRLDAAVVLDCRADSPVRAIPLRRARLGLLCLVRATADRRRGPSWYGAQGRAALLEGYDVGFGGALGPEDAGFLRLGRGRRGRR